VRRAELDADELAGRRILVVEDETLIALDLESLLTSNGCVVIGPVNTVDAALTAVDHAPLDAALLDLNLGGRPATPVAESLNARGVPYVVVTAYGRSAGQLPALRNAPRVDKPIDYDEVIQRLVDVLDKN
jgi:DNA-binding response OmpR family regulator